MLKTPYKFKAEIQIQRADNGNVITREINLSQVVQDAIVDHVSNLLTVTPTAALALIQRWRIRTIWIDEPVEG